jgi:hypothetical protein
MTCYATLFVYPNSQNRLLVVNVQSLDSLEFSRSYTTQEDIV